MHVRTLSRFVVLAAATALTTTACTTTSSDTTDGAPTSVRPSLNAADQLESAARQLKQTSFAMTLTLGLRDGTGTLTGTTDPRQNLGTFVTTTGTAPNATEWRVLGTVLYAKTTIGGTPVNKDRPWRRLSGDASTGGALAKAFDPAGMAGHLTSATNVHRSSSTRLTGSLDRGSAAQAFGLDAPDRATKDGGGAPPATVAFTADLDDLGRLTGYQAFIPATGGGVRKATMAFSRFGAPVSVQAPPPDQIAGSSTR